MGKAATQEYYNALPSLSLNEEMFQQQQPLETSRFPFAMAEDDYQVLSIDTMIMEEEAPMALNTRAAAQRLPVSPFPANSMWNPPVSTNTIWEKYPTISATTAGAGCIQRPEKINHHATSSRLASLRYETNEFKSPLMKARNATWSPGGIQMEKPKKEEWQFQFKEAKYDSLYSPDSNASTALMSPESACGDSMLSNDSPPYGHPSPVYCYVPIHASKMPAPRRAYNAAAMMDAFMIEPVFRYYEVEFKVPGFGGIYTASPDFQVGDFVIVEADRGQDLGKIVRSSSDLGHLRSTMVKKPVKEKNGNDPQEKSGQPPLKAILGLATNHQLQVQSRMRQDEKECMVRCVEKVKEREMTMDVVDAEFQFDCNKLTFYFKAPTRIDFRELVRDMFSIYKTRIWMEQLEKQ